MVKYYYQQQKQGIYYDGHEREDVVEYRRIFLSEIAKFEKYMKRIAPILNLGEKEHILVVHDECIFYSNDGKHGTWAKSGELPLCKKGNGKSIMGSEFLTEACGRLKLTAEHIKNYPDVPEEARVFLKPGVSEEGHWLHILLSKSNIKPFLYLRLCSQISLQYLPLIIVQIILHLHLMHWL